MKGLSKKYINMMPRHRQQYDDSWREGGWKEVRWAKGDLKETERDCTLGNECMMQMTFY